MVFVIISSVCLTLLILAFLLGMARGWERGLIRLGIIIGDLVVSLVCAPLLVGAILGKFATGSKLNIFKFSLDFTELAQKLLGNGADVDVAAVTTEIAELARTLMNIFLNIVVFLIFFIAIWLVSLIVYLIVTLVVKLAIKKEKKEEKNSIGLRFVGGFEGLATMLIILFSVLVPVFGVMGVCNTFIQENQESTIPETSAYSPGNLVAGQLYFTEDDKIGMVETYIKDYETLKNAYDHSAIGGFCNFTRLGKLGEVVFKALSNVDYKGEKINFNKEVVAVSNTYNLVKLEFFANKFDIKSTQSLDGIDDILKQVSNSRICTSIIESTVPIMAERFVQGEKFLGITINVNEQYRDIINHVVGILQYTKSYSRIYFNADAIIGAVKTLSENEVFSKLDSGNTIFDILAENKDILKDFLTSLISTDEIRNNVPQIVNDGIKIIYDGIVGDENFKPEELSAIDIVSWESEIDNISILASELCKAQQALASSDTQTSDAVINILPNLGRAIDCARKTQILSNNMKNFMKSYLSSEKCNLQSLEVKNDIIALIDSKWDYTENPDLSFETALSEISRIATILKNAFDGKSFNLQESLSQLGEVLSSDATREFLKNILVESDLFEQISENNEDCLCALEFITEVVVNGIGDQIKTDLKAVDAVLSFAKGGEIVQEDIVESLNSIADSKLVMGLIEQELEASDPLVKGVLDERLTENQKLVIELAIESSSISPEQKDLLSRFFN